MIFYENPRTVAKAVKAMAIEVVPQSLGLGETLPLPDPKPPRQVRRSLPMAKLSRKNLFNELWRGFRAQATMEQCNLSRSAAVFETPHVGISKGLFFYALKHDPDHTPPRFPPLPPQGMT